MQLVEISITSCIIGPLPMLPSWHALGLHVFFLLDGNHPFPYVCTVYSVCQTLNVERYDPEIRFEQARMHQQTSRAHETSQRRSWKLGCNCQRIPSLRHWVAACSIAFSHFAILATLTTCHPNNYKEWAHFSCSLLVCISSFWGVAIYSLGLISPPSMSCCHSGGMITLYYAELFL